jgi:hypothetical protein
MERRCGAMGSILRAGRCGALRKLDFARMHAAKRASFPAFRAGDVGVLDPRLGYARRASPDPAHDDHNQDRAIAEVGSDHLAPFRRAALRLHPIFGAVGHAVRHGSSTNATCKLGSVRSIA